MEWSYLLKLKNHKDNFLMVQLLMSSNHPKIHFLRHILYLTQMLGRVILYVLLFFKF